MMTFAERIAGIFNNDGACFDACGLTLEAVCEAFALDIARYGDDARYTFYDRSVITVLSGGWDTGYATCWCWESADHDHDHDQCVRGREWHRDGALPEPECPINPRARYPDGLRLELRTNNAFDSVLLIEGGTVIGAWDADDDALADFYCSRPEDLWLWEHTLPDATDPSDYGDLVRRNPE